MENKVTLLVGKRDKGGKGAARAVRKNGLIPAVIYGNKQEPEMITVEPKLLIKQMGIKGFKTRQFELEIKGTGKKELTLCQAIQYHKVKDNPIHVDFLRIDLNKEITVSIPFKFVGEDVCKGVKKGGVLNIVTRYADVVGKPGALVDSVEIDVTDLDVVQSIHASEVKLPSGLKFALHDDFTIATIASATSEVVGNDSTVQSADVPSATEGKDEAKKADNAKK